VLLKGPARVSANLLAARRQHAVDDDLNATGIPRRVREPTHLLDYGRSVGRGPARARSDLLGIGGVAYGDFGDFNPYEAPTMPIRTSRSADAL